MNNPFFTAGGNLMLRIEVFDWTSPDEQTQIQFHITAMNFAILNGELPYTRILAEMDNDFAREWLIKRELNMKYVREISGPRLKEPVLGARLPDADNSVVLIDGSHRYYRRYIDGCTVVPYHLVETKDWLPFAEIKGTWPCN